MRRVLFALGQADPLPPPLAGLLDDLAEILDGMAVRVGGDQKASLEALSVFGARLDPEVLAGGLSASVVLGQLRAAVVDLLEGVGVAPGPARAVLPSSS